MLGRYTNGPWLKALQYYPQAPSRFQEESRRFSNHLLSYLAKGKVQVNLDPSPSLELTLTLPP